MDSVMHFEVPYDDGERARAFYRDVFGWQVESAPGMAYDFVQTGDVDEQGMATGPGYIGGGMMERQDPVHHPVITLVVDDIRASLDRIEDAGGTAVHGPDAVGEMGFSAYFNDSEGNLMGLWQSADSED